MARNDLATNLQLNNEYWDNVKDAIEYSGVEVGNNPVYTYPDKIKNIKDGLDAEIEELENTKLDYESSFSDIDSAIRNKGQVPSGGYDTYADAILNISTDGTTINLQSKEVEPTGDRQTVLPDEGYTGLSSVVVDAIKLQDKQVEATLAEIVVVPDSGFSGLNKVVVEAVTSDIDSNIVAENIKEGISILGVEGTYIGSGSGQITEITLEDINVTPTTSEQTINANEGYDGIGTVTVEPVNLQSKIVEPAVTGQYITPDTEFIGISEITVKPVTSDIDSNIIAENIKAGVTILNVEGTYEGTGGATGGLVISDARYICYDNSRSIDDVLPLIKDCKDYRYAFYNANLTDGEDYIIDLSNVSGTGCLDSMFYSTTVEGEQGAKIKLIIGSYFPTNNLFESISGNNLLDLVFEKDNETIIHNSFTNMFYGANKIRSIDFGDLFDNSENIGIAYMFRNADMPNLDLDISKIDFSKVVEIYYMFDSTKLKSLKFNDLNELSLNNLNCSYLFRNSVIPLSEIAFNFVNCNLSYAFSNISVESIKLNMTDTNEISNVSNLDKSYLLNNNSSLTGIITDLDYWEIYGKTNNMFTSCSKLTSVPKIKKYVKDNNTGALSSMYQGCEILEEIYIEMIHPEDSTATGYTIQSAFQNAKALKRILGNLDMSYVTNVNSTFSGCPNLIIVETKGSLGGKSTTSSLTFDFSASAVFDATSLINSIASNDSGKTRIIKINSTVLNSLSDDTKALATSKNYTLQ